MVRLKPHPPFRTPHPVRPHGFQGTDSRPPQGLGLTPKPTLGAPNAPAERQAPQTEMDF